MKIKLMIALSLVLLLTSCRNSGVRGNGDLKEEKREVTEFKSIEVGGVFRVYVSVGEAPSLTIEAEDNLLKYITTKVSGSTLILDQKRNLNPRENITVYVTTPYLDGVETSGASKLFVENINSQKFRLSASGASLIKLNGLTDVFLVDVSGASKLEAFEFKSTNADIDLSGASKAEIYCDGELKVNASGVSKIVYDGNPKNVRTEISGLGNITSK